MTENYSAASVDIARNFPTIEQTGQTRRAIHLGQFRLARLQIANWGTFDGYKDIPIDERGVLFTGPSGSGKSSLMDAHSIVLLPTNDQRFNASADLTARGAKQAARSLADYVRGAWAETNDEHDQAQIRYLRAGKSTWSGVAATYTDGLGSITTAVAVKWFVGGEVDGGSLKSMYQLHPGLFDLKVMEQWASRGYDLGWYKKSYPDTHFDKPTYYTRELSKRVGLGDSKAALSLLGKAKAMKNVGDLNLFIRENMLDEPPTFAAAQKMVDAFNPLNEAFNTAKRAYDQEKVLREVPDNWKRHQEAAHLQSRAALLSGISMEHYLRGVYLRAVEEELDRIDDAIQEIDRQLGEQTTRSEAAFSDYRSIERELDQKGAGLKELESALGLQQAEAKSVQKAHGAYSDLVGRLGRPVPNCIEDFAALHNELLGIADRAQEDLDTKTPRLHSLFAAAGNAQKMLQGSCAELSALQSSRTLIPEQHRSRRESIAHGAGVPVDDLPYVAQLIDVADGEDQWRPAAEKVLRNFGLRLLVPDRHQAAVKRFIDEHDMRNLVEYHVVPNATPVQEVTDERSLAAKLTVDHSHPLSGWIVAELVKKFDHICVENVRDLDGCHRAVTINGTIKLPGSHYRKDDRASVSNPSSYILGGNVVAKRQALEEEVATLKLDATRAADEADKFNHAITSLSGIVHAARSLMAFASWSEIDYLSQDCRIAEIALQIEEFKACNTDLQKLQMKRDEAEARWKAVADICAALRVRFTDSDARQSRLIDILDQEQSKPHSVDDSEDRNYMDEILAAVEAPVTTDSMPQVRAAFRRELDHRRDNADAQRILAHSKIKAAITRFIEQWPDSAPDISGDVERGGDDFAQLHTDIVERKLPEAMGKFQRIISENMVPSISLLHGVIEKAASDIRTRIDMVNAGLKRVEFDSGTYLQIVRKANEPVEAKEFRGQVDSLLKNAAIARGDHAKLMQQVHRIRELMARFTATDIESRRWRTTVLDVRNAFTFYGREENGNGETVKAYRNTASNSGGEQEKLVAFCLAAALSYNLADPESGGRPSFAPLMLDEAFSKSDEKFAQQALAAFEEFGFQLIMAAPIRMSGIVEPFIGQAVLVDKHVSTTKAYSTAQTATFGELLARRLSEQPEVVRETA
ncbi:SbcC/MukB-like Walker B domain-containing protein [Nocardia fluminea]|uniref:ATP-binding protein n=1 Tax=Nocardia fluminea TaxID=134984 RepID=UPI0033F0DA36